MAFDHPRLLAASLTVALFCGVSCSTSGSSTAEGSTPGGATVQEPTAATNPAAASTAQDPQGQGTLEQQRAAALVAKYLQDAQTLRADGKLDAALLLLLKAKDLQPANERVRSLITAIQAENGVPIGTAGDYGSQMAKLQEIAEQRRVASVVQQMQQARQQMEESNFPAAVETLRRARIDIDTAPGDQDWKDLPGQLKALSDEAEERLTAQMRQKQDAANQELARRLAEENRQESARRRAAVDSLLQQGQMAFKLKRFQHAQDLSMEALRIEPNNASAFDLHTASVKAAREDGNEKYYGDKAREYRAMAEALEDLKVPQTDIITMDAATWQRAQARAKALSPTAALDPADKAIWDKVRTGQVGKLTFTEENGAYGDVVHTLREITGVPIIITPGGREVISGESLTMVIELANSISLENFLNHMVTRSTNLAWTVSDGVVVMGNKAEASGATETHTYDVRDLVFKRTQFLPPKIRDIPGSDAGGDDTPRTGGEGEDPVAFVDMENLQTNVKEATGLKYWESDGVEMRAEDQGYLIIKCSNDMHGKVASVLNDMRNFASPVVSIDSKFLTITKNFLQQVGVDFRGLGGSGNKGSVATLDDVTNGLNNNASRGLDNGGTGDPAASPVAGAFYNDGQDGDVRARSENIFGSDLGRALTTNGGMTAGWTYLNDLQFNMILQAVEKREDAEIMNSQLLTVMNNERGHVAVLNQTAYVRDFDVEVAQASFIADPKVDVIQDGIVLDVQPIIQQDRKYIIMQLQPTVAELQRPIPTFTTSLAGSTLPVTLQLPNLTVTNFSTTVRVPDGGTVLLGGLRQTLTKERRAEIPLLAQLPIVSFFFKQEGTTDENKALMVMVRAWITDVRDLVGK